MKAFGYKNQPDFTFWQLFQSLTVKSGSKGFQRMQTSLCINCTYDTTGIQITAYS